MVGMRQTLRVEQRSARSPILGLSHLELELLLSNSLASIKAFYGHADNQQERTGNYFVTAAFYEACKQVRDQIPETAYLSEPQLIVRKDGEKYVARINRAIEARIQGLLRQFQVIETSDHDLEKIFSRTFKGNRNWITERQQEIVEYACDNQGEYLESGSIMNLKGLGVKEVVDCFGLGKSTVYSLIRNLTVQLLNGEVVFVKTLLPANKVGSIKGTYALRELQDDQTVYGNGRWNVSSQELKTVLEDRFGVDICAKTVAKCQRTIYSEGIK